MRRLLVTGDVLRPRADAFLPESSGNIHWLHRMLRRPLAAATGLPVAALAWDDGGFDTPACYAEAGVEPGIEGWVRLFDATDLPRAAAAMLARPFADVAAVIGFELADIQKRLLSQLGVPWIDLNIHPYRFGPDLLFAIESNHPGTHAALRPHHAEDWVFEPWADQLSALAVKQPPIPVEERTLLVGQTRVDRSLIAGGRLIDLRDVATPLHAAIGPADRVLFKPHPYNPDGFGLHETGLPLHRIRETTENIYLLLAQDALRQVVGISSSVIAEARFFGRQGVHLGRPPFRVAPSRDALAPGLHASVVDAWLGADFWRDLLAPILPVTAQDGRRVTLAPNTLRNSLRQFWGWDEIAFQLPFDLVRQRAAARED